MIATVQSGGVVSVNPTANQSPDPGQGGLAVNIPTNMGHDITTSSASRGTKGFSSQTKTCLWSSFSGVSGIKTRVTLKFDWTLIASVNVSVFEESFASATADYDFRIEYSLDNGSTWIGRVGVNDSISMDSPGSDGRSINTSGSESIDLPNPGGIDITQIRVRDRIYASANLANSPDGSASGLAKASVSLIRLEVNTVPVITGVSSSAVTHNTATISWTTNEPADSQVEYGTTQAYGQWTTLDPTRVTAHSQGLSGLTPGTLYHYRVRSRDATGNIAVSDDFNFTTSTLDTTAPVISYVTAGGVTATTATISWTTDENSDSQVEYGTTQAYGQWTTLNPTRVTAHSQGLSGLTSETLYHYRVKSKDAAGNLAVSGDFTFTTADGTAPVISNVASFITTTTATITWTTNENSDSQVEYGTTQAYGQLTTLNPTRVTAHSQGLSGLTPGTLYHYRVKSKDATGNLAVSGNFIFTTAQNGSATIKWLVTDHLGSTRMVIDETGSLAGITRHDYLPFGEELFAGTGIRTTELGYGADSTRQKFTGKERDSETGLDFVQARYYSSIQGRFTSVDPYDPLNSGEDRASRDYYILQPQNWNRYAYALNNPHKYVDPDGKNPLLTALIGAVGGAAIGAGIEAAKAIYRGESLTDAKVLQRIGAKALNGAIVGGVTGLTGNVSAGLAAGALALGSIGGGIAERAVDGNEQTNALSASGIFIDGAAGLAGGYVGQKAFAYADDMTYSMRQAVYESYEFDFRKPVQQFREATSSVCLEHFQIYV